MVGVVVLPEKTFEKLKSNILPQWKICFFSALIVGIIAHFYKLTNWIPNWDSLVFRYDAQNMTRLGRWFLQAVCMFTSYYDLPWLCGLIAIVFHALGAVLICKIFDIKKGVTSALIGAVVVTFPTVTSVLMYNYVADGYSIAFFFSCLAAMNLLKEKPNYILAVIFITLSVAIYQAYIAVTIILILMYLINGLVYEKKDTLFILKKSTICLACGTIGIVVYYLMLMLVVKLSGAALLEYQGVSSTMSMKNIDVWYSIYSSIHMFFKYFFDFSKGLNVFSLLNLIIFVVTAISYILSIIKEKAYMPLGKIVCLLLFVFLIPIGANVLIFINVYMDYHNLMKMGYLILYLFFVMLYERMEFLSEKTNVKKSWLILVLSVALIFNQIVISNVSYHKLQMAYEKSYGTLIRIADRIEQSEDSIECEEVLVIGALPGSEAYSVNLPPDITGTTDSYILRADDETVNQSVVCSALNDYCGKDYKFISGERRDEFMKNENVQNMTCWPDKDSLKVIDGVIVIKLGAESE